MIDTPTRILDAAERLFAAHGFGAVSIREVTREADANVAAVHYHFGSKEELLRGVTGRVADRINARRLELLDDLERDGDPYDVAQLVEAFVRPDVEVLSELGARGASIAHFLGRVYSDPTPWIREMAAEQFSGVAERFGPLFTAALPHLDAAELQWRTGNMVAVLVRMFADFPHEGLSEREAERLVRRAVTYLTPGLTAPMPSIREVRTR